MSFYAGLHKPEKKNEKDNSCNGVLESDGGSLPFNGFDSCSESLTTATESTEEDEGRSKNFDYVLVSSTVTEDSNGKAHSHRRNPNQKSKDGSPKDDSQPALKLKLITKNRYEQK